MFSPSSSKHRDSLLIPASKPKPIVMPEESNRPVRKESDGTASPDNNDGLFALSPVGSPKKEGSFSPLRAFDMGGRARSKSNPASAAPASEWAENEMGLHVAMISMDKTGTIITTNNGARLLFGYPSGTMVGLRVEKLMPAQYSADHQAYVDKYVETRVSHGAIGSWKVRPAVRSDGEQFDIRIALSVSNSIDNPIFSALIDPLYEAQVKTDSKGKILSVSGSPWLLFGLYRDSLVGQPIEVVLRHQSDWLSTGERVVMCKNVLGDEFTALIKVKKDKDSYVGCFCQAPALRVKMTLLESGVIVSCTGESKALLGYKPKALRGQAITTLLSDEELAAVTLDAK